MSGPPLAQRTCKPCEGGTTPLPESAAKVLLQDLKGWELVSVPSTRTMASGHGLAQDSAPRAPAALHKTVKCKDFLGAVNLIQRIAPIAEAEDHHPDLHLTGYRKLTIELSTHSIGGLSENDFILAAKIDELLR